VGVFTSPSTLALDEGVFTSPSTLALEQPETINKEALRPRAMNTFAEGFIDTDSI
jgi:hypothetical protein